MPRLLPTLVCSLALTLAGPALGQSTLDHPVGEAVAYALDTGPLDNPGAGRAVVYSDWIQVPRADWLRLYFSEVTLGEGSTLRVTSGLDGETQELDAEGLAMWGDTTAYFNGNIVQVELVAGPGTAGNRVVLRELAAQFGGGVVGAGHGGGVDGEAGRGGFGQCGICGADDRIADDEEWTGRLLPVGCTAEVYTSGSCVLTAGHCVGSNQVLQFRVPASNANCSLNHPPIAEQFPVLAVQFANGGVGNDWAVMTMGFNNLAEKPFNRYRALRRLASTLGSVGQTAEMSGYGLDTTCVRSQTQQYVNGPITARNSSYYDFDIDVRGGNSGSALIRNGVIIGVVTHCRTGCPNIATRLDVPAFAAARAALCQDCLGDMDGDGLLLVADFTEFRIRYLAGDPSADVNGDGSLDVADFTHFRSNYLAGCL